MQIEVVTGANLYESAYNLLSEIDLNNFDEQNYIVVPDRFSLIMEKMVFDALGRRSVFNVTVLGLSRLARKVLTRAGIRGETLTSFDSLLLTEQAIDDVLPSLQYFKKNSVNFAQEVSKIISQFKSCKLEPSDIVVKNGQSSLKNKYHDLALIYDRYQQLISASLDANKVLALFGDEVERNGALKNDKVFFAGFDSFTAEAFGLIQTIARCCKGVYISMAKSLSIANEYIFEKDIMIKLAKLCDENGIFLKVKEGLCRLNKNQRMIAENLFASNRAIILQKNQKKCKETIKNDEKIEEEVHYYQAFTEASRSSAIGGVCRLIENHVRGGGKYRDISVALADLPSDEKYVTQIFDQLKVPYYIDVSVTAENLVMAQSVQNILRLVAENFSSSSIERFLSDPLFFETSIAYVVKQKNIYGKARFFRFLSAVIGDKKDLIEGVSEAETCGQMCQQIRRIIAALSKNHEKLLKKCEKNGLIKEKNINSQAQNVFDQVLASIEKLQSDYLCTASEMLKKLQLLLSYKTVSSVPALLDAVMIGDATNSYFSPCKKLFVLMFSSSLPAVMSDNKIVADDDLSKLGFVRAVEPSITMLNRRNRFKLFNLLTLAEENLTVIYSPYNSEGKKRERPQFVDDLNLIFDKREVRLSSIFDFNDKKVQDLSKFLLLISGSKTEAEVVGQRLIAQGKSSCAVASLREFLKINENDCDRNRISNAKRLFFKKNYTKVTQLETYFSCPFKHFVRYGLNIKEEQNVFDARDVGNICHMLAQDFVNLYKKSLKTIKKCEIDAFLQKNVDLVIQKLGLGEKIAEQPNGDILLKSVYAQAEMLLRRIVQEQSLSAFTPAFVEKNLEGLSLNYPLLSIDEKGNVVCEEECSLPVAGKVDRVDFYDSEMRIIDYKTGKVGSLIKDLYYGDKLQLFLYQSAVEKMCKKRSSGVFYFDAKWDYVKPEESQPLLKGLVRGDNETVLAHDLSLAEGNKSEILQASLRSGVALSDLNTLAQKIKDKIQENDKNIHKNYGGNECMELNFGFGIKNDDQNLDKMAYLDSEKNEKINNLTFIDEKLKINSKKMLKNEKSESKLWFKGSAIAKYDLLNLENYAAAVAGRALGEMVLGVTEPKPDEQSCLRCAYKGICLYDVRAGVRKKTSKMEKDIISVLGEADKGEE